MYLNTDPIFPEVLRDGLNFNFMPVYCTKTKNLYLVDESLFNNIKHKIPFRRARRHIRIRYIKIFSFVYTVENSPWRLLTPQHIFFLRNKHLLSANLRTNPRFSRYEIISIDSCYFSNHFQRMFSEVHKHWIWVSYLRARGKWCRRKIRLGYYTDYPIRSVNFGDMD